MAKVSVYNIEGSQVGEIELNDSDLWRRSEHSFSTHGCCTLSCY